MTNNQPETIIKTENLTKHFRNVVAVDNLNLDIAAGEIYGLVGPDGAGKTTTLRMLAAIMDPSSGEATVAGFNSESRVVRPIRIALSSCVF